MKDAERILWIMHEKYMRLSVNAAKLFEPLYLVKGHGSVKSQF